MSMGDELLANESIALDALMGMSNWGRWGPDDEKGALNLINSGSVLRALTKVRTGTIYPLGIDIGDSSSPLFGGRPAPQHLMKVDGGDFAIGAMLDRPYQFADDFLFIAPHGSTTHVDALCHVWSEQIMYNGFSGNLVSSSGALKLGIENMGGFLCRGILLDIAGYRGVGVLDPEDIVVADDITGCIKNYAIPPIEPGDAVLVRTGWSTVYSKDKSTYSKSQPGLAPSAALAFANLSVSLIGCDNSGIEPYSGSEPIAKNEAGFATQLARNGLDKLHIPLIRNLGIYLLEMVNLEQLAQDHVYDFMLCVAPLAIVGATGSPVNPLAVA